ncbi:MAG: hypothetical protein R2939_06915 [Kofleriaceae bacterium]
MRRGPSASCAVTRATIVILLLGGAAAVARAEPAEQLDRLLRQARERAPELAVRDAELGARRAEAEVARAAL